MNVAIIGAGVAGLACAKELNRFGIIPTIYEKRDKKDLPYMCSMAALNIYYNNMDVLSILRRRYNIGINPLGAIRHIEIFSPHKKAAIGGNLGYYFLRGASETSVINQLAQGIKAKVNYNMNVDVGKIKNRYDYVVIATGDASVSKQMNLWEDIANTWAIGSAVMGNMSDDTLSVRCESFDKGFGYICRIPIDKRKSSVFLTIPNMKDSDLEYYRRWLLFNKEKDCDILYNFEQKVNVGKLKVHSFDNILITGNSGGFLDPFLGFGFYNAAATGTLAARAIAGKLNYEKAITPFKEQQSDLLTLRKTFDGYKNNDIDKLVAVLGTYPVKRLIYGKHLNEVKLSSLLIRFFNDGNN